MTKMFKKKTIEDFVTDELQEAQLKLLKAQTAVEWAQAEVDYNSKRVKRLQAMLDEAQSSRK